MFELTSSLTSGDLSQFHFLRPSALFALLPALLLVALNHWRKSSAGNWEKVINSQLLPFLMQGDSSKKQRGIYWILTGWIITCLALAGPTWQQLPQPVHKKDSAVVLIMDLSPSMLAEDIKPSRLARARFKLIDILKNRGEGYTGLVVYGGEAHTLSPLTEDSNTIVSLVPTLEPALLPVAGSNVEEAVETALELAVNGGYQQGDLLLITDGVATPAFSTVQSIIKKAGKFRLSILGVGTAEGAPIPSGYGGFIKDSNGAIVIPKLSPASLQMLALNNSGIYRTLSADDSDINALLDSTEELFPDASKELERDFDLWDDQGYWLVILLLPILVASFRRGYVAVLLLAPALYSDPASAFSWHDLWQTRDQQATQALESGDAETAQALFDDPRWRGSAAYRAGDYQSAIDEFVQQTDASGHYNRGNALARAGDLDGAIEAYNRALELQPGMEDALANWQLIEQLKQQQQEQQNQDNSQDQQNQDQQSDSQHEQKPSASSNKEQSGGQPQDQQESQQQKEAAQPQEPEEQTPKERAEESAEESAEEKAEDQAKKDATGDQQQKEQQASELEKELSEEEQQAQQELQQWLRRVPDDPGGLLREKFRYQSRQRALEQRRPAPPSEKQQQRW